MWQNFVLVRTPAGGVMHFSIQIEFVLDERNGEPLER